MRSGSGRFSENPRECDRADHSAYKLGPSSHRSAPWTDLRAHGFVWVFWLRVLCASDFGASGLGCLEKLFLYCDLKSAGLSSLVVLQQPMAPQSLMLSRAQALGFSDRHVKFTV